MVLCSQSYSLFAPFDNNDIYVMCGLLIMIVANLTGC